MLRIPFRRQLTFLHFFTFTLDSFDRFNIHTLFIIYHSVVHYVVVTEYERLLQLRQSRPKGVTTELPRSVAALSL